MVEEPERLVPAFIEAGSDAVTIHIEACVHAHRQIQEIKKAGRKAGISIVPSTPVAVLEALLPFVDIVLVMTVNPGFGGQGIILECLEKIEWLDAKRSQRGYNYLVAVDGGIKASNASKIVGAGADVLVMGSAFFEAQDKKKLVEMVQNSSPGGL
jgi:ribulose-phosphate 3-epimerase